LTDLWDRWKEASVPKTSSIRPVVSIQYRLVTDRETDRHRTTACTALAQRRMVETTMNGRCDRAIPGEHTAQ